MKIKIERINSEMCKQISRIFAEDIKDPRLGNAMIGVTKVYVTPDLNYAKAYLSVFAENEDAAVEAFNVAVRSKAYIRERLKSLMNIRKIPDLTFVVDDSISYSIKIDGILAKIKQAEAAQGDATDGDSSK